MPTEKGAQPRVQPLGEVITLKRGYDLPDRLRRPGRVPIYSSSGPTGTHDEVRARGPGVVTGRYGTLGEVFFVREDFWPLNTALYVSDFKGNDPRFVSYLLRTVDFAALNDKSGVPGLNRNDLHEIEVEVPSRQVQRAIGGVLGALDDKIELNRRMNRTLEELASALFKSWFVDFDPVQAKRDGRKPVGVPAAVRPLFPEHFEESELGPVPMGWSVARLEQLCTLAYGKALPEATRRPGLVPVYGSDGQTGTHDAALVTGPGIVVGRKGNAGKVNFAPEDFFPIDTTFYVVPEAPWRLGWLYEALRTLDLENYSGDSAVPGLNRDAAYSLKLCTPEPAIMKAFDKHWSTLRARVDCANRESATLGALRDALLPALLSGEITIKQAETAVAEGA